MLRDGSAVLIRQFRCTDAALLADGFGRLSAASRQMRFLGVKKELSAAELRYFTDVDHHDHEALAAVDRADGQGVGIARYLRDAGDPQTAEVAVTIVDDWQGRGLGTELLAALSDRARQEGIRRLTALADAGNVAVAALLRNAGARLVRRERGTVGTRSRWPAGRSGSALYRARHAPGGPLRRGSGRGGEAVAGAAHRLQASGIVTELRRRALITTSTTLLPPLSRSPIRHAAAPPGRRPGLRVRTGTEGHRIPAW